MKRWEGVRDFSKKMGINPFYFLIPTFLAFLAALADGLSVGLLIPTVQGVINKSFLFVREKPFLSGFIEMLPGAYSQSNGVIFILLIFLIFISAVAKNILSYFSSLATTYQVLEFSNKSRKLIYDRFLGFGKMYFDSASFGHLHQILVGYTQQIAQQISYLNSSVFQFFSLLIYAGIGFFISWELMLFSMILFPILHFSLQTLILKIKKSSEGFAKAYNEMGSKISNALSCILLVKAYSNEEKEKQWFEATSDRVRDFQYSIDKKRLIIAPFQEIVSFCMILCLVGFMAYLLIREKTGEIAGFFVFFIVLRRATGYFGVFNTLQSTFASILGPLREIRDIFDDQNKFFVPEGKRIFSQLQTQIEFKNLNFAYAPPRLVLNGLNLSIRKGETVAIVGSSGSGKTTLAHLLMRFYDLLPGTLLIDGIDIREFTSQSLRDKMALVSQDTFILNASFKANLLYGLNREVSEKEIEDVLERARLLPLVELIGLDAPLGERGVKLSGGEKQRLSIARTMLKNPDILILDEATSALDSATEGLIKAALDEIVVGRTAIVIAHRLATIRDADRIVVLEKGRAVEEGSFVDLLSNREGYFYYYWQSQKLKDEE